MATLECAPGYHKWESGPGWGVIIGVSKCKKCGKVSRTKDFEPVAEKTDGTV